MKFLRKIQAKYGVRAAKKQKGTNFHMNWKALRQFGCYVAVKDRALFSCPMLSNGTMASEDVSEVTAPEGPEFLEAVNELFGTRYRMKDFAGR